MPAAAPAKKPATPIKKTPTPIAKKPATPAAPTAETTEQPTKSATLVKMEAKYASDPNGFLRQADHYYIKTLLKQPEMTHEEFCDVKIAAFTEFWENKKKNPGTTTTRAVKAVTDPAKLAKIKKAHEAAKVREARYAEMIALSEKAIAEATPAE